MVNCACKGIRTCKFCENSIIIAQKIDVEKQYVTLIFCPKCNHSFLRDLYSTHDCETKLGGFQLKGVTVLADFISPREEANLITEIDLSPWRPSQSGRNKQDYGAKVNFKKRRLKLGLFSGLPPYARYLVDRLHFKMRQLDESFEQFYPVELCNLEYIPDRGSAIVPHRDDNWLWGDRIILLNLVSETRMSFTLPTSHTQPNEEVTVEFNRYKMFSSANLSKSELTMEPRVSVLLPSRSLLIMQGDARHVWLHEINRDDISSRRISLTLRELSAAYLPPPQYLLTFFCDPPITDGDKKRANITSCKLSDDQIIGLELIKLAATYEGVCVETSMRRKQKLL